MFKEQEHPRDKSGKFTSKDKPFDDDNDFDNWDKDDIEQEIADNSYVYADLNSKEEIVDLVAKRLKIDKDTVEKHLADFDFDAYHNYWDEDEDEDADTEIVMNYRFGDGQVKIKTDKKSADFFNKIKDFEQEFDYDKISEIGVKNFVLNNQRDFYKPYQKGTANKNNFFVNTIAEYKEIENRPDREPDYISNSGSKYWYTEDGVIRGSDHWGGGIASCDWFLDTQKDNFENYENEKYGEIKWDDFTQKTKFILSDYEDYKGTMSTFENTTGGIPYSRYQLIPLIKNYNG